MKSKKLRCAAQRCFLESMRPGAVLMVVAVLTVLSGCDFREWLYGDAKVRITNAADTTISRMRVFQDTDAVMEIDEPLLPNTSRDIPGFSRAQYRLRGLFADNATFSVEIDLRDLEYLLVEVRYDE